MRLSLLLMLQVLDNDRVSRKLANNRSINLVATLKSPFIYRDETSASASFKGCEYDLLKTIASKDHLNVSIHILHNISTMNKTALK